MPALPLDEFANPAWKKGYADLLQLRRAFVNAINDLNGDKEQNTLLFLDFSCVYPLVTPRDNIAPSPARQKQDYAALQFLSNFSNYRGAINITPVYSPFLILELFDQLRHRRDYFDSVIRARNAPEMIASLKSTLISIPTSSSELEVALNDVIRNTASVQLASRLGTFVSLIKNNTIRSLFDFVDSKLFIKIFEENPDLIKEVSDQIPRFRRVSASTDPADRDFHKNIDILSVVFIRGIKRHVNWPILLVGQDRLRRIFGDRVDDFSRDVMTPFILIKTLSEVPSDRDLIREALVSLKYRTKKIDRMLEDFLETRHEARPSPTVVQEMYAQEKEIKQSLYGDFKMKTEEEYQGMLSDIARNMPAIKDIFAQANDDAKTAEEMLRSIAENVINKDVEEVLGLFPNDRLNSLMKDLRR